MGGWPKRPNHGEMGGYVTVNTNLGGKGLLDEVEWVFLGNGPSRPLRDLLESGGIIITTK